MVKRVLYYRGDEGRGRFVFRSSHISKEVAAGLDSKIACLVGKGTKTKTRPNKGGKQWANVNS